MTGVLAGVRRLHTEDAAEMTTDSPRPMTATMLALNRIKRVSDIHCSDENCHPPNTM